MPGILDDSLRLVNFTAACGPLVYRGGLLGDESDYNVFVPEPSANLIKRNIIKESGNHTEGQHYYKAEEFLASTDERFRPVSIADAPDGALYVTDMYRGIIQHKTYLTPYLKGEIGKRDLTQPLNYGRIYKITPEGYTSKTTNLPEGPDQLVALLSNPNGWIRDRAQQTLIDKKLITAVPALRKMLKESTNELGRIHALWALEGLKQLKTPDVIALLQSPSWTVRRQAFGASVSVISASSYKQYTALFDQLIAKNDTLAIPYIAYVMPVIFRFDKAKSTATLQKISKKYPNNRYIVDAVLSNLKDREEIFQKTIVNVLPDTNLIIRKRLKTTIAYVNNVRNSSSPEVLAKQFPKGAALYQAICQTCHGKDGNGVKSLAPPLNQSEWVTGDKKKLISVVLFGLTGPIIVNKYLYKSPEINGDMPGIGYDPDMPNEDIAQLLSYIRRSWKNRADRVETDEVATVRKQLSKRQKAFTADELR
jgi:mono/diheme cytochrome c family protein